ncbi:MAG: acyl-CoA dehydrogenase [Saprospiraceae bacterium]|nr:acyl-CoA dehydrogenase [Saprospiraceae bacterium]
MADQYVSIRNLNFILHEVLNISSLSKFDYYKDYDKDSWDMALQAAKDIGDKHLFPSYRIMDKEKAYFKDGKVWTHPALKEGIRAIAEGGWISSHQSYEDGGQQMPSTMVNAAQVIWYAANANISSHAFLTQGAANLIYSFGSKELQDSYLGQLTSGAWQGTMALTEPDAGSSLSDLTSSAEEQGDGTYKILGQKIYISGGDTLAVDNVVHLTLARIKGAPDGTRGISLFVVPKFRSENGDLVGNDVITAGIYGKMGQKGYVATHLMMGENENCHGYLVGEPNKGLSYMFQMMNEARIGTGLLAAGTASAAYYASLQYANERVQGRLPSQKNPLSPPIKIIEHADVKRMLLYQRAIVEGSIGFLMFCSRLSDVASVGSGQEKTDANNLFEILTPIAKSYPAEWGNFSVSQAMQTLGGAGYTDDFPIEQMYRDIRVNAIYEGTTGIHGLDLLGRKVVSGNGISFKLFIEAIQKTAARATGDHGKKLAQLLLYEAKSLHECTLHLTGLAAKEGPDVFLADATLYLEYFALVTIGWQWLEQCIAAEKGLEQTGSSSDKDFYQGKIQTARFYFHYEIPKTRSRHMTLMGNEKITLETKKEEIQ